MTDSLLARRPRTPAHRAGDRENAAGGAGRPFNPEKPFIFTSGWASPVYTDMRKIISHPRLRKRILDFAVTVIEREIVYESLDVIAGGETAGIPYAAWMADRPALPMQYIRKKPKGFGRNAQIEGDLRRRARASGGRPRDRRPLQGQFLQRAARSRSEVRPRVRLLLLRHLPVGARGPRKARHQLHSLATWWDVLKVARASNYLEAAKLDEVEKFLHEPANGPPRMAAFRSSRRRADQAAVDPSPVRSSARIGRSGATFSSRFVMRRARGSYPPTILR